MLTFIHAHKTQLLKEYHEMLHNAVLHSQYFDEDITIASDITDPFHIKTMNEKLQYLRIWHSPTISFSSEPVRLFNSMACINTVDGALHGIDNEISSYPNMSKIPQILQQFTT